MKTKPILTFAILLILLISCSRYNEKEKAKKVLDRVVQKYLKHTSVCYDVDYAVKFFDGTDTTRIQANVKIIRDKNDTLFEGKIDIIDQDNLEIIYLGDCVYSFDHSTRTGTDYSSVKDQSWPLKGRIQSEVIRTDIFEPEKLFAKLDEADSVFVIKEEIDSRVLWKIAEILPDDEEVTDIKTCIWVNKIDSTITRKTVQAKVHGKSQYNEWSFSNYRFDQVSETGMKNRLDSLLAIYKIERFLGDETKH